MSPNLLLLISLILILVLYLMFTYQQCPTCVQPTELAPMKESSTGSPNGTNSTVHTQGGQVVFVAINPDQFRPRNIVIRSGTTIIWTNHDSEPHSVTSLQGDEIRSSLLRNKEQHAHTFEQTGKFVYYDTINPFLMGTIHVISKF